jgi:hypothetical protein
VVRSCSCPALQANASCSNNIRQHHQDCRNSMYAHHCCCRRSSLCHKAKVRFTRNEEHSSADEQAYSHRKQLSPQARVILASRCRWCGPDFQWCGWPCGCQAPANSGLPVKRLCHATLKSLLGSGRAGQCLAEWMMLQHLTIVCWHRDVLKNLAKDERWSPGWAYDGRKSMHAPNMFLPQAETSYNVRCTCTACSWRCIRGSDSLSNSTYGWAADFDCNLTGHGGR